MNKYMFALLLQVVAVVGFSQTSAEEFTKKTADLIKDAATNSTENTGDKLNDNLKINVAYYKSKTLFGSTSEGIIMLDNDTKKKVFMCIFKQDPNASANIEVLKIYIAWSQTINSMGQTNGYTYERKPGDDPAIGGFVETLKDAQGKLRVRIVNNMTEKSINIFGR